MFPFIASRIVMTMAFAIAALNALSLEEHRALVLNTLQNLRVKQLEISPLATPSYVRISMYSDDKCTSTMINRVTSPQLDTYVRMGLTSAFKIALNSPTSCTLYLYDDISCTINEVSVGSCLIVTDCVMNTSFGACTKMEITSTSTIAPSNERISYR